MRLITHTDFDGIMCAVLLIEVEEILETKFTDPATLQAGLLSIDKNDIIADLPFDKRCGLWFDHHESSKPSEKQKFNGSWKIAPSAARVIYDYYENPYLEKFSSVLSEVDKIDSGKVPIEEVNNPSGWFLLSNTLESSASKKEDDAYRNHVIELIRKKPDLNHVFCDEWVKKRIEKAKEEQELFRKIVAESTKYIGKVAFSDLRERQDLPKGNNYIVYSLFKDAVSSVRLMPIDKKSGTVKISVGHNIYGQKIGYNVGEAMKKIGGGGHQSVGGAVVKSEEAEKIALQIIKEINEWEEKND